ncbi:phage tail protein [Serratia rubidaea]|nr:phage tail protein [Serratia rubidaea]
MTKYKAIVTTAGAAKIAAASAGGKQLKIVQMAVGDGGGKLPTPTPTQTQLVNERYRAALNGLDIVKTSKNSIVAELIIPATVGGFWLREMGLYDEDGALIAVGNMAESYKPKLEEGSGRTQTLRMILIVSSTDAIQVIAGDDTVLATKDFVAGAIAEHEQSRNHPDASTTAKGFVMLSSATNSPDETKAVTPAALKKVNDATLKKTANLSDVQNKETARRNLALGTAATRNVGAAAGQLMTADDIERRYLKLTGGTVNKLVVNSGSSNGDGTPLMVEGAEHTPLVLSRTNDQPNLAIGFQRAGLPFLRFGVGTDNEPRWGIDANNTSNARIYTTDNPPTAQETGALTDGDAVKKYALRSIKVNGKPLSADVNLLAGDVNAWNKTEADARYLQVTGGVVSGKARFNNGIEIGNTTNAIELGEDGAGYKNNNLILKTWQGIGFYNSCPSVGIQGFTGYIAARVGDLRMARNITADGQLIEAGKRVYSPNNPPSPGDIGAVAKTGDVMTGDLTLPSVRTSTGVFVGTSRLYIDGSDLYFQVGNRYFAIKANGDISAPARVIAGESFNVGNAYMHGDGNIWGTRWNPNGGWLWDEIINQVNSVRDTAGGGWFRSGSSGRIIQAFNVGGSGGQTVRRANFPIPFPNGVDAVTSSWTGTAGQMDFPIRITSWDNNGVNYVADGAGNISFFASGS